MLTRSQEEIFNQLTDISFCNSSKKILISGHAGSGKSFVLRKLKKELKNKPKDHGIKVTLFKSNTIFNAFIQKKLNNLIYKSLYTKELKSNLVISFTKLVLSIFKNEYSLYRYIHDEYGEGQGKSVFFLIKYLLKYKKFHNVLIFDNLNFWDSENIGALNIITYDREVRNFYKNLLDNTSIIISYSDNYYISNELSKYLYNIEKNKLFKQVFLKSIDIDEAKEYMQRFGIKSALIDKYIKLIYKLSFKGNLALINASCRYLINNETFSNISIEEELSKILDTLLINEKTTENVLASASLFGEPFLMEHLIQFVQDLYSYDNSDIEDAIANAINKFIVKFHIENNAHYVDFIDSFFSNYLKDKHKNENIKYYKAFAEFLEYVYPSQYQKRYNYNRLANNIKESDTLYALYIIKEFRFGNFDIDIYKNCKHKDILKDFKKAYQSVYLENESFSPDILHSIDIGSYDTRIKFEKDYLISLNELEIADINSFNELYKKNIEYIKNNKTEKELIIRAQYILFMIEMYKKENIKFSDRLREFTDILNDTIAVDKTLNYYKYSLYRRFRMQHEPEYAASSSLQSVEYFEKHKDENILFKREYFFSLVNHSDNLFQMDNLNDALKVANDAYDFLINNYEYLPQITLINNLTIFDLLTNKNLNTTLINKCLKFVENIDLSYENRSTYIMLFSNISSVYAYTGDIDKAMVFSNNALKVLRNQNNSFSRYSYHIEINRAVLEFFQNREKPNFNKIFRQEKYDNDKYMIEDPFIKKQLDNYDKTFNDQLVSFEDMWALDDYMQKNFANQSNRRWNVSTRPLKFFTMQYWSK